MTDIILDTNVLADFLSHFYFDGHTKRDSFSTYRTLNDVLVRKLNRIVYWHNDSDYTDVIIEFPGIIVSSTFAFIEITRKFQEIVAGRFTLDQFAAFIDEPPEWFLVSSVDSTLLPYLVDLPANVHLPDGTIKPVELADAIHLATAMSRDDFLIATTDERMRSVEILNGKFV